MARLIDADRALEIVFDQGLAHPNAYHLTNYATLILREAPTVDAVEVVHGRWMDEHQGFMYYDATCSVCGKHNDSASKFCPNCGAKMDGDGNG